MAGLEGQTLGGCRIIKRLGAGGMGQVYLAEQIRLGREVAVKVVRPPRSGGDDAPALADAPERFKLEARAIAALEHPNILPVHEFGIERELMYLVMPLMPDGSLFDAMRPGGPKRRLSLPISPVQAAPLIFQAASALEYAHQHNIIHRDVKPENFLIRVGRDDQIEVFLADFGLVKEYHPGSNTSTLAVGTADYVAPEQIEGRPVPASDQYALAVMTYELLAGQLPFRGAVAEVALKHLREEPPPPRSINPAIPAEIEQVILRALRKKPQDRWPSIKEYAHAYSEVLKKLDQRQHGGKKSIEDETTQHIPPGPLPARPAARGKAPVPPPSAYETQAVPQTPPSAGRARQAAPQQARPAHNPAPANGGAPHSSPAAPPPQAPQPYPPPSHTPATPQPPTWGAPPWNAAPPNGAPAAPAGWPGAPSSPLPPTGQASGKSGLPWLKIAIAALAIVVIGIILGVLLALHPGGRNGGGPSQKPPTPLPTRRLPPGPPVGAPPGASFAAYSHATGTLEVVVWSRPGQRDANNA